MSEVALVHQPIEVSVLVGTRVADLADADLSRIVLRAAGPVFGRQVAPDGLLCYRRFRLVDEVLPDARR